MIMINLIASLYAYSLGVQLKATTLFIAILIFTTQPPEVTFNDILNANTSMNTPINPSELTIKNFFSEDVSVDISRLLENQNITEVIQLFPQLYLFAQDDNNKKNFFFHQENNTELITYIRSIFQNNDKEVMEINPTEELSFKISKITDTKDGYLYILEIGFKNFYQKIPVSSASKIICGLDNIALAKNKNPSSSLPCCKITPSNTCCITDEKKKKNKK